MRPIYSELSPQDQWHLHDYFRPAFDDNELILLTHRRRISQEQPSLPQSAGRAWLHFQTAVQQVYELAQQAEPEQQIRRSHPHTATNPRRMRIKSVVRPEINVEQIARAVFAQVIADAGLDPVTTLRSWDSPSAASELPPASEY